MKIAPSEKVTDVHRKWHAERCQLPPHEPMWVEVNPSPGSDRTEPEVWPTCLLVLYGGNAMNPVREDAIYKG